MELLVLNMNLEVIDIIDTYESLIWNEKYNTYGDFEIYSKLTQQYLDIVNSDCYLKVSDSKTLMIVEDYHIKSDSETGLNITITGRSMETILDRRIIWSQTALTGDLQDSIETLLNDNAITPSDSDREITGLTFQTSMDTSITNLTIDAQFTFDNLYKVVSDICVENDIGFKIELLDDLSGFVFYLYAGIDRSYNQFTNPYVVFSPEFDNIINSDFKNQKSTLKTITLVAGQGEGSDRKITTVGSGSGLSRREMHTDARDMAQEVNGVMQSDPVYYAQLEQRGSKDLAQNGSKSSFDNQVDTTKMYKYGTDYYLGDIVQMVSEYGISVRARITEIIRSYSTSGIEIYPKFTILD